VTRVWEWREGGLDVEGRVWRVIEYIRLRMYLCWSKMGCASKSSRRSKNQDEHDIVSHFIE
jgi:hypothetical protein